MLFLLLFFFNSFASNVSHSEKRLSRLQASVVENVSVKILILDRD